LAFLEISALQIHVGDKRADRGLIAFKENKRRLNARNLARPQSIAAVNQFLLDLSGFRNRNVADNDRKPQPIRFDTICKVW
jgi:hypothetical protein